MNSSMFSKHLGAAAVICAGLLLPSVHAAITYVDATTSNTIATDGDPAGSGWQTGSDNGSGLWELRAFGNSGSIFEAQGDSAFNTEVDHEALTTTITGLTAGASYNVFVYFWSNPDTWEIDAGLVQGSLTEFTTSSPAASAGDFVVAPLITEGPRTLYQGALGLGVANGSGALSVFVDDGDLNTGADVINAGSRSWYDGVGYELVAIPEPSSLFLAFASLAALALVRRRR